MVKKKKDFGEHDKKTAARERKAVNKKEEQDRQAKKQEDEFWREAGEGALTKAQSKRKEQEKQKQEALAKKQEIKELAKTEEEILGKSKKPKGRAMAPKVTQHALLLGKEQRAAEMETEIQERKRVERKEVDEETYARLVDVDNVNRSDADVDARNVTEAIHALEKLTPAEQPLEEDAHPEKRRKAAFKRFYEAQLAELQDDKPGLRLSQYKDIIFKRWLKSPENPMNRTVDG